MFCESYLQALTEGADGVRDVLPEITRAAEAAVPRLLDGGDLYIASTRPDFVSEGFMRAGGMMLLRQYDPASPPSSRDVVIAGWSDTDSESRHELLARLRGTGALVIGIGPAAQRLSTPVDVFLRSDPPCPASVLARLGNESYPLVSLQNLVLLWTFTGELVAALTRRGRMPAMFQSVLVPGAQDRNASFQSARFHSSHEVPAIPVGQLGGAYVDEISFCLGVLRDNEIQALIRVARACAEVLGKGHHIHAFLISHFPVHQAGAPGDPGYMKPLESATGETPDTDELDRKLAPGDLFFFLGYYRRPSRGYEIARRHNCAIVEVIAGTGEPVLGGAVPDHIIHPCWPYTDSLVGVPGYDVRILPSSGILQSAIYWSVIGEITENRMAMAVSDRA
jgi:hypothetical protein